MTKIYELKISNFRGIKSFEHRFAKDFYCLLGRGDSCKTTILEAISYVLSPNWNVTFFDNDFFNGKTNNPIEIEVSLIDFPEHLLNEDKYGLYIRGLDSNGVVQDNLEEDHKKVLTIKLEVTKDLEPQWLVINKRQQEPYRISARDREKLNVFMISDYLDRHFSWTRGGPLYSLLKERQQAGDLGSDVIIEAIRVMKTRVDSYGFEQFQDVTETIKKSLSDFGLGMPNIKTTMDLKDVSIKDGKVCLHDADVPLRLKGKGTKRLASLAIQTILVQQGGILLIDEIEQGLEADRVKNLVRTLKNDNVGQIFLTTHSCEVITELDAIDLLIVNNNKGEISLNEPDINYQSVIRACPEAGFAKKVIVCEGKTEIGVCRALDKYRKESSKESMSSKDCVYVLGEGDSFTSRALRLKELGKNVSVFCDSDKDGDLNPAKAALLRKEISIFDCEIGNNIEKQVFLDLPWNTVVELVLFAMKKHQNLIDSIKSKYGHPFPREWEKENTRKMRIAIAEASVVKEKEWFKSIGTGEYLGNVIFKNFSDPQLQGKEIFTQLTNLITWIDI